jgi:hypothetical protein
MTTHTADARISHQADRTSWALQHPAAAAAAMIVAAVLAGVLIGVLFSLVFAGTETAALHRAGGHAAATAARHVTAASPATPATDDTGSATHITSVRSPARSGFAAGRAEGAGSGFITLAAGEQSPARGGFAGRSLGAGRAPATALMRPVASGS